MNNAKELMKAIDRSVSFNVDENIREIINTELERVILEKAEELGKKYYRNISVKFGAIVE